jgi:uncharacterized protein with HEPN domain
MRDALQRLEDARTYAQAAINNAIGLSPEVLAHARQPLHAALYDLVVIGEALGKVPEEVRRLAPEIPWAAIVAVRNHVVHSYWQIDLTIIADVIENRMDPLIAAIDRLIDVLRRNDP